MKYLVTLVVSTDYRRAYKENLEPNWLQEEVGMLMNLNDATLHEVKVVPIKEGQPDMVSDCPNKTAVGEKIAEELGMPMEYETAPQIYDMPDEEVKQYVKSRSLEEVEQLELPLIEQLELNLGE